MVWMRDRVWSSVLFLEHMALVRCGSRGTNERTARGLDNANSSIEVSRRKNRAMAILEARLVCARVASRRISHDRIHDSCPTS